VSDTIEHMFDTLLEEDPGTGSSDVSPDQREQRILDCERVIAQLRALQAQELSILDRQQVATADGARTLIEWCSARFDLAKTTARDLVLAARSEHADINTALADGDITFDRATHTTRLANTGYQDALQTTAGYDIGGLHRVRVSREPLGESDEYDIHQHRSLALQPRLDESHYTGWLTMAGTDAKLVEAALMRRAERLRQALPDGTTLTRGQLLHDSLVDMAADDLAAGTRGAESPGAIISVFIDPAPSDKQARTDRQPVATSPVIRLDNGVRIGPTALQHLLCRGAVIELNADSEVLGIGRAGKAVPPRLKRWVTHRDLGACTIAGCNSTYRLEPHHIIHWENGGETEEENLTTLCWFHHHHHHIAIHRHGFRIDPQSPPQARQFHRKPRSRPPP